MKQTTPEGNLEERILGFIDRIERDAVMSGGTDTPIRINRVRQIIQEVTKSVRKHDLTEQDIMFPHKQCVKLSKNHCWCLSDFVDSIRACYTSKDKGEDV